ncbi:hypothetical protein PR003_g23494, partial [Phytophthora rubi]
MLFASFVAEIPGMPNISEFRAVRVLRPLRSLSAFPGMRRLITALLNAIPALQSVVALQMFAFLIFGILGIQLFGGRMGHVSKLNWGFTTYDHLGRALLTIFQSVTEEGWTLIMYMTMDASHPVVGACFAIALIIFASYFVMNLTIAVISEEFKADKPVRRAVGRKSSLTMWGVHKKLLLTSSHAQPPSFLHCIVTHRYFSNVAMAFVFANTVTLSLDHYPMSRSMEVHLEMTHFVFLCVFVVELLLKLTGLGMRQFLCDRFNIFDAVVVVSDLIEVAALQPSFLASDHDLNSSGARAISILRAFRLFRVFRLARRWKSLRDLLGMITKAVASIGNFAVLLFLFLYIFALMGMQFFANTMRFDDHGYPTPHNVDAFWNGTVPRSNFDTLPWSIATVFQVVTGDNWSAVLYDAIRGNGMFASVYFIVLVVLGDFVLMNLFLALLLDNFATRSDSSASEGPSKKPIKLTKRRSKISPIEANKQRIIRRMAVTRTGSSDVHWQTPRDDRLNASRDDLSSVSSQRQMSEAQLQRHAPNRVQLIHQQDAGSSASHDGLQSYEKTGPPSLPEEDSSRLKRDNLHFTTLKLQTRQGKSLYLFGPTSKIRRWASQLSAHPTFESVMFAFIAASSIVLALENPLHDPDSLLAIVLLTLDKV